MGFWAMAGPALMGAAGSALGALTGKKGKGGGYDIIPPTWMPGMERLSGQQADYLSLQLQRMQEGKEPEWWSRYAPILKQRQTRGLEESMYGVPGERKGAYAGQMEAGALAGLGGGQTTLRTRPLYSEYLRKGREIDETLAGLGANIMQQGEQTYLQNITNMPHFQPQSQIMAVPEQPAQASPWASILGSAASMIPWGNIGAGGGVSNIAKTFGSISPSTYTPGSSPLTTRFSSMNNLNSILGQYGMGGR